MKDMAEITVARFKEGFACSESVLMGFTEVNGIDSDIIPKIATGFAGGIGRGGSICGALSGAIMALGLRYGRSVPDDQDAYEQCVGKSLQCFKLFEEEFGQAFCRDLIGLDLSTPEGQKAFRNSGLRNKKCTRYVEGASDIVSNLIQGSER